MSTDLRPGFLREASVPSSLSHLPDQIRSASSNLSLPDVHLPDIHRPDLHRPDLHLPHADLHLPHFGRSSSDTADDLRDRLIPAAHDLAAASRRQARKARRKARKLASSSASARQAATIANALAEEAAWRADAMRSAARGTRSHRGSIAFASLGLGLAVGAIVARRFAAGAKVQPDPRALPTDTPHPPHPATTGVTVAGYPV
jgi:hypothetical protein